MDKPNNNSFQTIERLVSLTKQGKIAWFPQGERTYRVLKSDNLPIDIGCTLLRDFDPGYCLKIMELHNNVAITQTVSFDQDSEGAALLKILYESAQNHCLLQATKDLDKYLDTL